MLPGNEIFIAEPQRTACQLHSPEIQGNKTDNVALYFKVNCADMLSAGIKKGDIVSVNSSARVQNGSIVIALISNKLYIRRLKISFTRTILVSDNPLIAAIDFNRKSGDLILGVLNTSTFA